MILCHKTLLNIVRIRRYNYVNIVKSVSLIFEQSLVAVLSNGWEGFCYTLYRNTTEGTEEFQDKRQIFRIRGRYSYYIFGPICVLHFLNKVLKQAANILTLWLFFLFITNKCTHEDFAFKHLHNISSKMPFKY